MPVGRTSWIMALTPSTRRHLLDASRVCVDYLVALSGTRHLISDYDLHTTITVLYDTGTLGVFHSITERGPDQAIDPTYLTRLSRALHIRRYGRCVYMDSHAGAVVSAKLNGWEGCLIAPRTRVHRKRTRETWYDTTFSNLRKALHYYIFGTS